MKRLRRWIHRLRGALSGRGHDSVLAAELESHLEMQTDDNVRAGMSPEEARRAAVLKFGGVESIKEGYRDQRGIPMIENIVSDSRYAVRGLARNPGFAGIAVLTLALGIGASTAMFSMIRAVLIEPLPYKDPDRLMVITEKDEAGSSVQHYSLSYVNFQDWSVDQRSFSDLALFRYPVLYKLGGRERSFVTARMVSANFLSTLGVAPIIGRDFTFGDDFASATPTVILSYAGWQKLFGPQRSGQSFTVNTSNLLEEDLQFNGTTYRVIGVLPREFKFYTSDANRNADVYIPIGLSTEVWKTDRKRGGRVAALGRLKPGVVPDTARAELVDISRQFAALYPAENESRTVTFEPLFDAIVDDDLPATLRLIGIAVVLVLLIACANVANLLLARGVTRQKEFALRTALGGGRWRVTGQVIIESIILALAGGAGGVVVAIVATDLLVRTAPVRLPRIETVSIDWSVLAFSAALSVLIGVAFGLVAAMQAGRRHPFSELKEGGTDIVLRRFLAQRGLIVGEVAMALILLLAAGLVLRSTQRALNVDPGFDPEHVWIFNVVISPAEFSTVGESRDFFKRLETRLAAMPEVEAVSTAIGGIPKPAAVDEDYLRLMGVRLLKGRFFDSTDTAATPPVVVIDEVTARTRFGETDPIGLTFSIDEPALDLDRPREIIGVVSQIRIPGLGTVENGTNLQDLLGFYLATEQVPDDLFYAFPPSMLIKTAWAQDEILSQLEAAVQAVNPNVGVTAVVAMENAIEAAMVPRWFVAELLSVFATTAFVLAMLGIFGLMTYFVSQRTREIGVRMALGARSGDVVTMVLKQAGVLAGTGIALGILGSFGLSPLIGHLLLDLDPVDPVTYGTVVVLLFSVALAAAYVPAFGASRLEPMMALKGTAAPILYRRLSVKEYPSERNTGDGRAAPEEGSDFCIAVHNLHKTYGTRRARPAPALSGVSFGVEPGTIFGLIGQNGAGKTTLIKILLGLMRPTGGSARLLGCSPGDPIASRRIGYLPEQMRIPDYMVPEQFLRYMGRLNGIDSATLNNRIPVLLERVGLGGIRKPVRTFSKGMQQRLGLAQSLLNDPEVLILNEPTDGLDPLGRIFVRDLLLELRASGKTIFLNSHLLSEIELVCDRIVILDKGAVACMTTPDEFTRGTGEYRMQVDTADGGGADTAERVVRSVVGAANWKDGALRFTPQDLDQLDELIGALRENGVRIVALEPARISLEQFFIQVITERES